MTSDLARRVTFAACAIPVVLGVAWVGRWALAGLLAVAAGLGAREIYGLARARGIEPLSRLGVLSAALTPLAVALTLFSPGTAVVTIREGYLVLLWFLAVVTATLVRRSPDRRPLAALAVTIFGVLYAGWLPSFALQLRHPLPGPLAGDATVGMALLVYPLTLTWVGDSLAMAGGKAFGGPKLAPVVSPNKTWSGGVTGLFGTVALSLIYAAVVFRRVGVSVSLGEALLFGALISLAGQLGDAAESLFKREVGVKDSSALIPGHGGVLDRLDSLYFVLPITAMLYRFAGVT